MSAEGAEDAYTVDELAAAVGLTVRTTRYYASLGLLPPPERRGRVAYYGALHRARLELVRALQDHGFTLQAIERFLASVPEDAGVEDLALQRAMLTSWSGGPTERLTRAELDARAGRALRDDEVDLLEQMGVIDRSGERYLPLPSLAIGVELLDLGIPAEAAGAAAESIRGHMESLVDDLTRILRTGVLAAYRAEHSPEEAARLEQALPRLRQLTLEAIVAGFQRAANAVITRSLMLPRE
ncbi:MerR family transcriptional regulator [Nocardioides fonticola]|uniref:MerR family transcriptional regulator n=1 Tax=Nocardioides fonticola TaxID=450363 RepID=A0ABP7XAY6_9ACTN